MLSKVLLQVDVASVILHNEVILFHKEDDRMPESKAKSKKPVGAKKKNSTPAKKVKPPTSDISGKVVEMTQRASNGKVAVVEKGGTPEVLDTKSPSEDTKPKPTRKSTSKKKPAVPKTQAKDEPKPKPKAPEMQVIPLSQDAIDHIGELLNELNTLGQQILGNVRKRRAIEQELERLHEQDESTHKDLQATVNRMRKRFNVPDGLVFDVEGMVFTNMPGMLNKNN